MNVGTMIDSLQVPTNNGVIEKYCYNNKPENCTKYAGIYQWNEVMQYGNLEKSQGICPIGWHIPTISELYDTLSASVNFSRDDLLAVSQSTGNNSSGFSALFAGYRYPAFGGFHYLGFSSIFWSSSTCNSTDAYDLSLYSSNSVLLDYSVKTFGFSIRCLKN